MELFNAQGQKVILARELGRGGEGAVFEVATDRSLVAKIYHKPVDAEKAAKLALMSQMATPGILTVASWPLGVLRSRPEGPVMGFVQSRATGHEIHTLYGPNSRAQNFPRADWRFLVHVAMNCAAAVETIHENGHVIGDVNSKNIWVTEQGTVCLVDCDSFQVTSGGSQYLCEVGVDSFTPPELQGKAFRSIVRTPNHDAFGLAILIFHLLFVGRHPYAGRFSGKGDMPVDQAIRENRFVYGFNASTVLMTPPPFVPPLTFVPPVIVQLFERAFDRNSDRAGARPSAERWRESLNELRTQMRTCSIDSGHSYFNGLQRCPWCAIVEADGPNFFASYAAAEFSSDSLELNPDEIERMWHRLGELKKAFPMAAKEPTGLVGAPVPDEVADVRDALRALKRVVLLMFSVSGIMMMIYGYLDTLITRVCLGGIFFLTLFFVVFQIIYHLKSNLRDEILRRQTIFNEAHAALGKLMKQYESEMRLYQGRFETAERTLSDLKTGLVKLRKAYEKELEALKRDAQTGQLHDFLDRHFIHGSSINIPKGLVATLLSYGIETALDIDSAVIRSIPGIGATHVIELETWKQAIAMQFRFDASRAIPEREARKMMLRYQERKQSIRAQMIRALAVIEASYAASRSTLVEVAGQITRQARVTAQARADLEACTK